MRARCLWAVFLVLLTLPLMSVAALPKAPVVFYADKVKYPLFSVPEPVLVGGKISCLVVSSLEVKSAKIVGQFRSYDLSLTGSKEQGKLVNYTFSLPEDVLPGLYNLTLETSSGSIVEPNSVWVLRSWPTHLKLFLFGDVKTPTAAPYLYETVREMNLINPDVAIFLGDLVETPVIKSAWQYFLGSFLMLKVPTYVVVGNHEYESTGEASIYQSIVGPLNYSVRIGNFLIVVLPSDKDGWVRMKYLKWADEVMSRNEKCFKILAFHHPLFNPRLKELGIYNFTVNSADDFSKLLSNGYIYPSWADHPEEAKYLFELVLKHDVRIIASEHIHTDLNVMVVDSKGHKHYFISPSAIAYDIREHDIRGYKILSIYSNGTVDLRTTYYDDTGFAKYPNSIPLDSGEGVEPYQIGLLKYYYVNNDGKHGDVSFFAVNELKQGFKDVRIVFRFPKDVDVSKMKLRFSGTTEPKFTVITGDKYKFVVFEGVELPAKSSLSIVMYSSKDSSPPSVEIVDHTKKDSWLLVDLRESDSGWGPGPIEVEYNSSGVWKKPSLVDLQPSNNGTVGYVVWIPYSNSLQLRVKATDLAGNSVTKIFSITEKKTTAGPTTPSQAAQPGKTTVGSPSISSSEIMIAAVLALAVVVAVALLLMRRK